MYLNLIFAITCIAFGVSIINANEFYWKEWHGTVPYDAVPGGTFNNKTTYIGSTLFINSGKVKKYTAQVVTTIYGNGILEVAGHLGNELLKSTERTLILCAPFCEKPIWKHVRLNEMLSTGCKFITGGFYDNVNTYIARGKFGKNILLGQVFPYGHRFQGFEVWDNKHLERIKEFEALAFCP